LNMPNIITLFRFLLIPVFIFFMSEREFYLATAVFLLAGFSDFVDGYLARKYSMVTKWGKLMDPLADKLLQLTALFMIGVTELVPNVLPVLIVVAVKELIMFIGSLILLKKGVVVSANWYGKVSTVISYTAIVLSILVPAYGKQLLFIAAISALFALFQYFKKYSKHFVFCIL